MSCGMGTQRYQAGHICWETCWNESGVGWKAPSNVGHKQWCPMGTLLLFWDLVHAEWDWGRCS